MTIGSDPTVVEEIRRVIARLTSLQDGDIGVLETIACGRRAIPALKALLFEPEPSGLYQPRCRAVEVLAALGAQDVLIDFLKHPREVVDPVERTGEEAVVNAAARALIGAPEAGVFPLLLEIAKRQPLAGVIEALGTFRRLEALPSFIAALFEDFSRPAAEAAIRQLGVEARPALLLAATERLPSIEHESVSSLRRRRSVLGLLTEIGMSAEAAWPALDCLMHEEDPWIVMLACRICLDGGPAISRLDAARCLVELLSRGSWLLRQEIDDCLVAHFDLAKEHVEEAAAACGPVLEGEPAKARTMDALRRIMARAGSRAEEPSPAAQVVCAGPKQNAGKG